MREINVALSLSLSSLEAEKHSATPSPFSLCLSVPLAIMLAKPCSLTILQPRLTSRTKQLFLSNFQFLFPAYPRYPSSLSAAQSQVDGGSGGGRTGALTPPPVADEVVQKIDVNPPKGTRDFPPEEMRLRNWLFHNFREVRACMYV